MKQEHKIPRNIKEEVSYIQDQFSNDKTVNPYLAYGIVEAIRVYDETGDGSRAVKVKESYRVAGYFAKRGEEDIEMYLMEVGEMFADGNTEEAKRLAADIVQSMLSPHKAYSTEKDAIKALAGDFLQ